MTKPIEIREIKAQETYPLRHEVMWPDEPLDFVKLNNDVLPNCEEPFHKRKLRRVWV